MTTRKEAGSRHFRMSDRVRWEASFNDSGKDRSEWNIMGSLWNTVVLGHLSSSPDPTANASSIFRISRQGLPFEGSNLVSL